MLKEYSKDCLIINGGQNVKLEKEFIEFKNYSRQIPVPFKIYADFECLLKGCDSGVHNNWFSYTSKYQNHTPCSFAYKLLCTDDKYSKDVSCSEEKILCLNLFTAFSKNMNIVRG